MVIMSQQADGRLSVEIDHGEDLDCNHGRGPGRKSTRYNTEVYAPEKLYNVLKNLRKFQPKCGYTDKQTVQSIIARVIEYAGVGPRDDLLRFLLDYGVLLYSDSVYIFDVEAGERLRKACEAKQRLDPPTPAFMRERFDDLCLSALSDAELEAHDRQLTAQLDDILGQQARIKAERTRRASNRP